jgi:PAS domain S-box-containing protein
MLLQRMVQEERSLLKKRSLATDRSVLVNNLFAGISYLFSFALLLAVYTLLQKQIRDRAATEATLNETNQLLETKIQERTAQLTKIANHLRTIIDAEPDCVKTLDLNGKILEINTSGLAILGADNNHQVIGEDVLPLIKPQYKETYCQLFKQACLGIAGRMEAEIITLKDVHRWIESHAVPLYDEKHHIFAILAISRDITLIKQAEVDLRRSKDELEIQVRERTRELLLANETLNITLAKLQLSNEELERFAYVASHDLQEPLRTIASFTQILERKYHHQLDPDADEYIEFIVDGAKRMQQLITDLLAYSRIGRQELKLRPININEVLKSVMQDLQAAIAASGAQITYEALPTLLADSMQIAYLWQNLLNNAIKYRGELPPQIHITATPKETEWLFAIGDNGIGIEMEYAERIFAIFQRLHTSDEYPGTGLGLAICQKVVERHGGRIWLESKFGYGSTFYFTLPIRS